MAAAVFTFQEARERADELIRRREAEVERGERCRCGNKLPPPKSNVGRRREKCDDCKRKRTTAWAREKRVVEPYTPGGVRRVIVYTIRRRVRYFEGKVKVSRRYRRLKPAQIVAFYEGIGYRMVERHAIGNYHYSYTLEKRVG